MKRRTFLKQLAATGALMAGGCRSSLWHRPTIRILYFDGLPETGMIKRGLREFELSSGIKVDFCAVKYDDIHRKLDESFKKSVGDYDVVFVDDIWMFEYAHEKSLVSLNDYIKQYMIEFTDDYSPKILRAEAWLSDDSGDKSGRQFNLSKDDVWLIPQRADVQVLFYNKAIFKNHDIQGAYFKKTKHQLTVPETWEDYSGVAEGLHGLIFRDQSIVGCAETLRKAHFAFDFFSSRYWAISGQEFFGNDNHALFASNAGNESIEHFRHLSQFWSQGSDQADHESTISAFAKGNIALCPQWYTFYARLKQQTELGQDLGVALLPGKLQSDGTVHRYPSIGGGSLGIPANSRNKPEAWAFIRHFTGADFCKNAALEGMIVTRRSAYEAPEVKQRNPEINTYLRSIELSKFRPRLLDFHEVESIIGTAVSKAIMDPTASTRQLLDEAGYSAEEIIKKGTVS